MFNNGWRNLPLVEDLVNSPALKSLTEKLSSHVVAARVRAVLEDLKDELQGSAIERKLPDFTELAERIARQLRADPEHAPRPVIDASGILLGRKSISPALAEQAVVALAAAVSQPTATASVEQDIYELLMRLTRSNSQVGHSFGTAIVWALGSVARDREVVIARGQVCETWGNEHFSDLASMAGVQLREVGGVAVDTADDYRHAITDRTAAILWAPPARYSVLGGTVTPLAGVVEVARAREIPVVAILQLAVFEASTVAGLNVPQVSSVLGAGVDLVILPGDQLIGGPASGLVIGRSDLMDALASNPLAGMFAADVPRLAALAATLRLHLDAQTAQQSIPILRLLNTSPENLKLRASRLAEQLRGHSGWESIELRAGNSYLTGTELPGHRLANWQLALKPMTSTAERLVARLSEGTPKVICGLSDDRLWIDLRSVLPRQDQELLAALLAASGS